MRQLNERNRNVDKYNCVYESEMLTYKKPTTAEVPRDALC